MHGLKSPGSLCDNGDLNSPTYSPGLTRHLHNRSAPIPGFHILLENLLDMLEDNIVLMKPLVEFRGLRSRGDGIKICDP